jgi:hypothetical protein
MIVTVKVQLLVALEVGRGSLLNTYVLQVHRKDGLCFGKSDNLLTCIDENTLLCLSSSVIVTGIPWYLLYCAG